MYLFIYLCIRLKCYLLIQPSSRACYSFKIKKTVTNINKTHLNTPPETFDWPLSFVPVLSTRAGANWILINCQVDTTR